ncbi:polysaccharide export protein [Joostella atrarenae]|uniref:Polysaccharide export protein n=1 Tax=Joostella atrarenae TaxID=679257 RepID=A0ABS9J780_9FLAO|nr:polysaccharide biosynthesis/export family protein [Joostella atrarenae]MCF8716265.1 polysaccharide export protein [Joostella atrarenae]
MKLIYKFSAICCIFFVLFSCVSERKVVYLQDLKNKDIIKSNNNPVKISNNDLLTIIVSSSDIAAAAPFNLPITSSYSPSTTQLTTSQAIQTYLVNQDGNINFPVLGEVNVAGKTRNEVIDILKKKISQYLVDPIINLRIVNYNVTILGEVNKPGQYTFQDEHVSLLEAIGTAGDLTIYGKRDNILVIREVGDSKTKTFRVNIKNSNFINSPVYYLQQNDIVYVVPNKSQVQGSSYNRNAPVYISLASVIISLIVLFTR